jgi:glycosyltransferase involved in cell wall biosynthesis
LKFIALIPFKNEERFLPACLSSIVNVVDEIICIDDGSTDRSREIAESFGCKVYQNDQLLSVGWAEHHIRQNLLALGRKAGGTHFLCLDADEALTYQFGIIARFLLPQINPGQNIRMQWLSLWKSPHHFRADSSVWSNNFKDFIFADDGKAEYEYRFLHVSRTPVSDTALTLNPVLGAVLHYQFSDWESFNIKQADYRCSELIKSPGSEFNINNKYAITLQREDVFLAKMPESWFWHITEPDFEEDYVDWRYNRILEYFKVHGTKYFENLQIWHIDSLRKIFFEMNGRNPGEK